jgi:hypothetical protein
LELLNFFCLEFNHLGLAVKNPDKAIIALKGPGYTIGNMVFDPAQNVNLIMCTHNDVPNIEIINPSAEMGLIDNILKKFNSGFVYHCCYITKNLEKLLNNISMSGIRTICVSQPKPTMLFNQAKVLFYALIGVGLVEILESLE